MFPISPHIGAQAWLQSDLGVAGSQRLYLRAALNFDPSGENPGSKIQILPVASNETNA